MAPETYDPETYVHWLHWKVRCLEDPAESFERMFQSIAERAGGRFVRVRPYGKFGDRKVDGLHWDDGTAYQVYSPDELKEADTRRKIEEDLAGAVAHWGNQLRRWVFVYNVRRGLAPDVARLLHEQQARYPDVSIEPLSAHDLWEIVRGLSFQARVEILGPPSGIADVFPLSATVPEEVQERLRSGRFIVIQDIMSPVNIHDAIKALEPAKPLGPPLFIRPPSLEESWELAAAYQKSLIDDALARSREKLPRFAVFSLSPIPLAIHLGFLLSDRVEVEPFQFHRDRKTWVWSPPDGPGSAEFKVLGMPSARTSKPTDVSIRVCLSADVQQEEVRAVTGRLPVEVEVRVARPDVGWLVSPTQLQELSHVFRGSLADLRRLVPNASRLHLFYAGPTGGAIVAGQAINPRMNPPVALYEYSRQREPRYHHVLSLP